MADSKPPECRGKRLILVMLSYAQHRYGGVCRSDGRSEDSICCSRRRLRLNRFGAGFVLKPVGWSDGLVCSWEAQLHSVNLNIHVQQRYSK